MKLSILLQSLQTDEYRAFEKFLLSPFFKYSEQYSQFFKFLCKHHPSFELDKNGWQTAYRRCFGPQSLNETKLHNLMSGLGKQIEQFLVVQLVMPASGKAKINIYDQLLVESLSVRNMGDHFRTEALALIKKTASRPGKELDDYLALHQLHHLTYYNPDVSKSNEHIAHLPLALEHLDQFYCTATLRYAAEMKTREGIFHEKYQLPMLEAVLEHSSTANPGEQHPLWAIYYQLVNLYRQGVSEPGFRDLMTVFTTKLNLLPKLDQTLLLPHLINCGISLLARDVEVEADLLLLYKIAITNKVLPDGNRITYLTFINIVNFASLRGEFDWAKDFIAQFSRYLEQNKRQETIDLAMAGLYYNQGQLQEARDCLKPELFLIDNFEILSKNLLLKILFDRYLLVGEDYEYLISFLKSFEKFIQDKPLMAEKKAARLNWIRFVRKMSITKFEIIEVPESQKEQLRKNLRLLQPVISKRWLMAKIDLL